MSGKVLSMLVAGKGHYRNQHFGQDIGTLVEISI
jgi:hypothetical protein